MQKNNLIYFIATTIFCVIFDWYSKYVIEGVLDFNQNFTVIPSVLSLEKVYNTGAAFSILQGNIFFLILISVLTLFVIVMFILKQKAKLLCAEYIAFGLITGGAVGNLIDRIAYSHVIDFIQLDFINFPIFNFADIFINIGVIILIICILNNKNEQ